MVNRAATPTGQNLPLEIFPTFLQNAGDIRFVQPPQLPPSTCLASSPRAPECHGAGGRPVPLIGRRRRAGPSAFTPLPGFPTARPARPAPPRPAAAVKPRTGG